MNAISRRAPVVIRIALGALFFVFGLDGFFHFAPHLPMTAEATHFIGALVATGYMFPLIKGTEVVAGALLLSGRLIPLSLTLLAPIIVNIALFHLLLQPSLPIVLFLLGAETYLAYVHRAAFSGILKVQVDASRAAQPAHSRLAHSS